MNQTLILIQNILSKKTRFSFFKKRKSFSNMTSYVKFNDVTHKCPIVYNLNDRHNRPQIHDVENLNMVKNYHKIQGLTKLEKLGYYGLRDIYSRHATIENGSKHDVKFGISLGHNISPSHYYILRAGEIMSTGLNHLDAPQQFIHIYSNGFSRPFILHRNSNSYVFRYGTNGWFVDYFHRPSYKAAS